MLVFWSPTAVFGIATGGVAQFSSALLASTSAALITPLPVSSPSAVAIASSKSLSCCESLTVRLCRRRTGQRGEDDGGGAEAAKPLAHGHSFTSCFRVLN